MSRIYIKILLIYAIINFIGSISQAQINFFNSSIDKAMAVAHQHDKNILVYYTADWCAPCQVLEESHFKDESITYLMNNYYLTIKADFDTEKDKPWFELQDIKMLPTIALYDENMNVLSVLKNIRTVEQLNITLTRNAKKEELVRRELVANQSVDLYKTTSANQVNETNSKTPTAVLMSHTESPNISKSKTKSNALVKTNSIDESNASDNLKSSVINNAISKPTSKSSNREIIQFGAYTKYDNAVNQLYALRSKTIDAFILEEKKGHVKYYKVVESASNSDQKLAAYKAQGVDCFSRVF